jgi:hypothetical protein
MHHKPSVAKLNNWAWGLAFDIVVAVFKPVVMKRILRLAASD